MKGAVIMNMNNKKIIALLMTIVVVLSILNVEYNNFYNSSIKNDEANINECYISQEVLNILEQKNKSESNNFQAYKFYNKIVSNYFNKYIEGNIYSITNNYKLKYTAVISDIFSIYNDSVFVVTYIHKADGKKKIHEYF